MAAMDRDAILAQIRLVTLLEDTNVTDAEIVLLINSAIDEVSIADYWPFLESSATMSTVDSVRTIALPTNFEYAVALVDDDNDETVPYIAPTQMWYEVGNDTGNEATTFRYWTIWEDKVYLTPIPEANDTDRFTFYYYKSGTQLDAGATKPDWHEAFHNLIVEYVKWKLWDREEYFDQSERAFITYSRYLDAMSTWYARRAKRSPWIGGDGRRRPFRDYNVPLLNN
jgi:hypothetical protein